MRDVHQSGASSVSTTKDVGDGVKSLTQPIWYGPLLCCYATQAALYYYWVNPNGTYSQYCHVDVQSGGCSTYTSCFDYGYSTGCLYWI